MVIYAIIGGIGSGKTLAMTHLALQDYHVRKRNIISNIHMKIPGLKLIDSTFLNNIPEDLSGYTICIDEIHNVLDSRSGSKATNKKRTHFILQSRHVGKGAMDLYCTTQHLDQIDKRLRRNVDILVYPQILQRDNHNKPIYMAIQYNFQYGQSYKTVTEYFYVEDTCDMYDTHERVELDE